MLFRSATPGVFALGAYLDRNSEATGQTIMHLDLDHDAWIAGANVPAEYEAVLRPLTETVESGNGSHPNGMVEQITGTGPRKFRDFARKNAVAGSEAAT